jgi:protein-S-isoprenylcysteine O-methyltransferase Ste14
MAELDTNKPGYKTTEAIVPLASSLLGCLVAFGVLTPDDQEAGIKVIEQAIGSLTALAGWGLYVWGRIKIKLEKIKKG